MNPSNPEHQSQTQDNLIKETTVGRDLVFAPVQIGTQIETQIIQQISRTEVTQRQLIRTSPYQGLSRFNVKDHDRFFGRDKLIADLSKKVNQSSLTVVLGASGSGKSSVVRAGLIPELKKSLETQKFYDFIFTPNQDPFASLHRCILSDEKDYHFSESEAKIVLQAKEDTLTQLIKTSKKDDEYWLIFIDQFEELFTSCNNPYQRENFIKCLVQVVNSGNSSVKIILAMRSDFMEHFSFYKHLGEIANQDNMHVVTEMFRDELRQAIEAPAAKHGVVFEEGLVDQIINDVEGQTGYLPLLQYTLNRLWEIECKISGADGKAHIQDRTLNKKNYTELEGVRGALQKRVNKIYSDLSPDEQKITKQIFLKLVNIVYTDSGSKTVSRRAYRHEFVGKPVEKTLNMFVDEKLLVSSSAYSTPEALQVSDSKPLKQSATVEIAHENLISSWKELKDWIEEEKEVIILKNFLIGERKRWQEIRSEKDESKSQNQLLSGSRLTQVIDFQKKDAFKNVGGLSQEDEEYIKASVARQRQQKRQKQFFLISLAILLVISGGLGIVALVQYLKVKVAEQRRQEELVRSAWISLKPSQKSYEECITWLEFGLRDLYCGIKPLVDYRKLIAISGLPIFRSGPHTDSALNLNSAYDFGYYNPEFLEWIKEKAILDPDDNSFKQQIQSAYNDKIRVVARAFYQSHKILFTTTEKFEAFEKQYRIVQKQYKEWLSIKKVNESRFDNNPRNFKVIKDKYLESIQKKTPRDSGDDLQEDFRWLSDYLATQNEKNFEGKERDNYWYVANVSGGFWVRRSIDGTEQQFFDILMKLLEIYDSDWLRNQELLATNPSHPNAAGVTIWNPTQNMLYYHMNGEEMTLQPGQGLTHSHTNSYTVSFDSSYADGFQEKLYELAPGAGYSFRENGNNLDLYRD